MEVLQQNNQYIIKTPMDSVNASVLEKLLRELRLQELLAQRKDVKVPMKTLMPLPVR